MKPPVTYAQWSDCLDRLIDGTLQTSELPILDSGKIEWSKGSAERFASRFADAYDKVLKQCASRLQKNLSLGANNEFDIVKALTVARRTLTFLFQISLLKPVPEDLRNYLQEAVNKYAKQAQSSLEQSAKSDRSGRLASLLKNNSLLNFNKEAVLPPTDSSTSKDSQKTENIKPQRRILL
ncbi:hypothetical protein G7B40_007535 [Aetokthonos hydrillicola Thurmond2011]|jgi:hypothetical protein|uniref:Uncharacterized protein n=1 Tax=Aetokthonos hydrillicola Thurmond2011 TaxID=2712845 RepID=A0AAP5M986_9CYAN|nr:hypothetical protein [Aetokthonos hydrillicola]MBO3460642.1 hypothetical protein [Aetokthonos hydrillicola CCALA 1050]MBW4587776.1 hypothetical protein [Aetokthonos hydrillicola CCALA 1050]MDR9894423.1 hypothetical protein [Aetokthonos hydrillicola Thurmond2011]